MYRPGNQPSRFGERLNAMTYELRTAFSAVMRSWRERRSCLPARPGMVVLCAILRVAFLNIRASLLRMLSAARRGMVVDARTRTVKNVRRATRRYGTVLRSAYSQCGRVRAPEAERPTALRASPDAAPRRSVMPDLIVRRLDRSYLVWCGILSCLASLQSTTSEELLESLLRYHCFDSWELRDCSSGEYCGGLGTDRAIFSNYI